MADRAQLLEWSFISTLVGGILVLVTSAWMAMMMTMMARGEPWMMWGSGMPDMMVGMMTAAMITGVALGAAGIVAALQIRNHPSRAATWGIVAIVAGALSLVAMGGGFVGAAALVAGGALALAADKRDQPSTRQPF